MLKLVPGRVYAGNSAWYIELKYKEVESKNKLVILLMWARFNAARLKKNGSRLLDFSSSTVL